MTIYYGLLLAAPLVWLLLCGRGETPRRRRLYLLLMGLALVAVATLRYSIGFDYFNYERIFLEIQDSSLSQILSSYVYQKFMGYALLNKLVACLGGGYLTLLLLINLFLTWAALWVIHRHSKIPWLSVFLYITLQFFAHSMNLLRQSIAAAICLLAIDFVARRRLLPVVLLTALACTVHLSAVFLLGFYLVAVWRDSWKLYLPLGGVAVLCYCFSTQITQFVTRYFLTSYAGYVETRYWSGLKWSYAVFPAAYFLIAYLLREEVDRPENWRRMLLNSAFYTMLLYFFSTAHMILERFSIFVFPYALLLIPDLAEGFAALHLRSGIGQPRGKVSRGRAAKTRTAVAAAAAVLSLGYFHFAAAQGTNGFHKVYPYVGLWERQQQERPGEAPSLHLPLRL